MNEIRFYYDKEKENEIKDRIVFDTIKGGKTSQRSIFVENNIKYPINVTIHLKGENVDIINNITQLPPFQTGEVVFEFDPKLTQLDPIKAKLKVKINYIVK